MKNYRRSVENAYQKRSQFTLIALTGRTGSGCSTTASILHTTSFQDLDLSTPKVKEYTSDEERKYSIVYKYMSSGRWVPFTIIEGSSVILSFIIEHSLEELKAFLNIFKETNTSNKVRVSSFTELEDRINGMTHFFEKSNLCKRNIAVDRMTEKEIDELYYFYIDELPSLKDEFKNILKNYFCVEETLDRFSKKHDRKANFYTYFMQKIGNNIRSSGNPYSENYTEENYYQVANRINEMINVIRRYNEIHGINETRICIDAIRNPYEAFYFKDIYSSFYLISVNTEEEERRRRLGHLDDEELASLDNTEYSNKLKKDETFFHQDIRGCLEISDIHLYNPVQRTEKRYFLTEQILKYLCLMIHPGLVTPTNIERCMQLAYNAKLNSGCLSRQVGAMICDQDYSIKAVGWNDVPSGQVPCNLRDVCMYCVDMERESHSAFEIEDPIFSQSINALNKKINECNIENRFFPYCFKDVYEGISVDKNQVHTRSLHAEENAFLQISKYGGQGINGGILFTTASPCELCSKKAYQLGIKDIYYIDPYPGISFSHILRFGAKFNPSLHLFYGAIGSAYVTLYTQRMPIKDELELMTGLSAKRAKFYSQSIDHAPLGVEDIQYIERNTVFTFETREKIICTEGLKIRALHDNISVIPDAVFWTGSSFDGISLMSFESSMPNRSYFYEQLPKRINPFVGLLTVEPPFNKDEIFQVVKRFDVKDSTHIMVPYIAQRIKVRTNLSGITIRSKPGLIKNVKAVIYAGMDMSPKWIVSEEQISGDAQIIDGTNYEVYSFLVNNPILNYCYCLEWTFS